MAALSSTLSTLPFSVAGGAVTRRGDCGAVDLNAFAKGWIVDAAIAVVSGEAGIESVLVSAGGDLAHAGAGGVRVGVENPQRPFDNEPPLLVFELSGAAAATSGSARRGFRIGGVRYGHVLDPRTGRPVEHTRSATVVAPRAAVADAVATIVSVLEPSEATGFTDRLDDVSCCVVAADGTVHRSSGWTDLELRS
ncbi:MAG: FAD:protein FMN transferase [Ilumatobacteraceae bacterium]